MDALEVRGSEGDLAGIAGIRVGFDGGLLRSGHSGASAGDGSHGQMVASYLCRGYRPRRPTIIQICPLHG